MFTTLGPLLALWSALFIGQITEVTDVAEKLTKGGAATFNTFLILILGGALAWLHRDNKKEGRERLKSDEERFRVFASHHDELVKKIDVERAAMNMERGQTSAMLIALVKENSFALLKGAEATDNMTKAVEQLTVVINAK